MDNREAVERMSISGLLDVLNTGISLSTCHMEYTIQSNVLEDLVKCLEELEQYRELGTVEQVREAADRMKPKKAVEDEYDRLTTVRGVGIKEKGGKEF